ncbi:MAG: tol-pal system-associated acyl-CoA thioesterase [Halieaceae bacterium]|jgi:tol-pal system-associated acyl-CoA thioesterase|nr:tol-pal system-associated acyl-CoA thioesterase [Halieaceae bacterium]
MNPFSVPVRVYIEDTDAGGIVYYVNYLKFMERARTEFMRSLGFGKDGIFNDGIMFVVRDVKIRYVTSAVLDDELRVVAEPTLVKGARFVVRQSVHRNDELLADALVECACVSRISATPVRIPAAMRDALSNAINGG